jgi:hypothetical protein
MSQCCNQLDLTLISSEYMNQKKAIKLLVRSKILGKLILKLKIKEYVNQKPKNVFFVCFQG